MVNAKEELKNTLSNLAQAFKQPSAIQYACVWVEDCNNVISREFDLFADHTPEELQAFWNWFDFNYDVAAGEAYPCGVIVLDSARWIERYFYDGCQWWEYLTQPASPKRPKEIV